MAAFDINSAGFAGFGGVASPIVSDTAGFFGFGAVKNINLVVQVVTPPNGGIVRGLLLTLNYGGTNYPYLFDPQFPFERLVPTDVTITITATGDQYVTQTQSFTVSVNQQMGVLISLVFVLASTRITRKRYL